MIGHEAGILAAGSDGVFSIHVLGNELWRWLAVAGVLLGAFVLAQVLAYFADRQVRRLERIERLAPLRMLLAALRGPMRMVIWAAGLYVAQTLLPNLDPLRDPAGKIVGFAPTGPIRQFWIKATQTIAALGGAWLAYRLVEVVEYVLKRWAMRDGSPLANQLLPLIRKTLRVVVVIMAGLFIAQNIFEWEISALLAGLGISGLAFALAAKDSLANLFGSVVIFADRPFAVGELVSIQGKLGTVQQVGFRSTKLTTLDGTLVTIPNSVVANETIENFGRRPYLRRLMNVGITYDTPPAKVSRALEIVRELLDSPQRQAHWAPNLPPKAFFNEFKGDNLNILILYWYTPADWWAFHEFNQRFNLELLERFNAEGIQFAFPTQTLYLRPEGTLQARLLSGEEES